MNSWQAQLKNSYRSLTQVIKDYPHLSERLNTLLDVEKKYPIFIPKRIMDKISEDIDGKISKQFLPQLGELNPNGLYDPIGDIKNSPVNRLVHRYENRVLFFPTSKCPINCRYCFRKNEISSTDQIFSKDDEAIEYLKTHPLINEIIFSGGDPLILTDDQLEKHLDSFSKINHIKQIRFHTRFPTIIPDRIDTGFISMISKYKDRFEIIFVIHTNCVEELDEEVKLSLTRLSRDYTTLSQSVILKDINDSSESFYQLCQELLKLNVRPYYSHFPDDVLGAQHYKITKAKAQFIHSELRQRISGHSLPVFIFENSSNTSKEYV